MIVYKLDPDTTFKRVLVDTESLEDIFSTGGGKLDHRHYMCTSHSRENEWVNHPLKWYTDSRRKLNKLPAVDFTYIGFGGSLIVSPKAKECLAPTLENYVDFLPVTIEQEPELWFFMNVRNYVDAEDKKNSVYGGRTEATSYLQSPAFLFDRTPKNQLFLLKNHTGIIFFAEDNRENNFKTIVEKNKLKGLEFIVAQES